MNLNERKIKILQAIVNDYIQTAEPVGSRTIAKKYDLGISSATIRNEMSDLEELGYIKQPHASAGRIPSDQGYRLYVDKLMGKRELTDHEKRQLQGIIIHNIDQIDFLMQETAKIISNMTHYTTIATDPVVEMTKLKQIRLIPLDQDSIMLIAVTDENMVKNMIVRTQESLDEEALLVLTNILNKRLKGLVLDEINQPLLDVLSKEMGSQGYLLKPVLELIKDSLAYGRHVQVHLSGTKNILAYPEFSDIEKAKGIFQTLEEKEALISLLGNGGLNNINIVIGNENTMDQLKDLSVITSTYKIGDNTYGSIGILGPTRMDYSQVVSVLTGIVGYIEKVIKLMSGG